MKTEAKNKTNFEGKLEAEQNVRNAMNELRELGLSMTEIGKLSDLSEAGVRHFLNQANGMREHTASRAQAALERAIKKLKK